MDSFIEKTTSVILLAAPKVKKIREKTFSQKMETKFVSYMFITMMNAFNL